MNIEVINEKIAEKQNAIRRIAWDLDAPKMAMNKAYILGDFQEMRYAGNRINHMRNLIATLESEIADLQETKKENMLDNKIAEAKAVISTVIVCRYSNNQGDLLNKICGICLEFNGVYQLDRASLDVVKEYVIDRFI